ncbi:MAG: NnrS family protein [Pseudomonadales bacterium]|nr:NnrS family protein [Pseudomonadales bacterium]
MPVLFNLGFRPFFLGAAWFAVISMALWMAVYGFHYPLALDGISASQWHAHEMLYGYAIAVIAGFLLTSIRNWTGLATLNGLPLALGFGLWLAARLLMLLGTDALGLAACADLLFMLVLIPACAVPIIRARQWRQMAILSKLLMLGIGNALFYAGALGLQEDGLRWSLYGGLYLVIALILTMARRVIPAFTERGIEPRVQLRNSRFLDFSSLILLLVFWVAEVFLQQHGVAAACSAAMFVLNAIRLTFWYRPGIWKKPLLWSLFVAFAMIDIGFLLFALSAVTSIPVTLAVHAFAVGGIALITLAMMARVALGHTGRSVHQAPAIILVPMTLLLLAFMTRVVGPLVAPLYYTAWVMLSQACWIAAFTVFGMAWFPILTRARIDGAPG